MLRFINNLAVIGTIKDFSIYRSSLEQVFKKLVMDVDKETQHELKGEYSKSLISNLATKPTIPHIS